jgi:hypothetical protein
MAVSAYETCAAPPGSCNAPTIAQRDLFWPLLVAASILEAVAAASFAAAVFSDPVPRRVFDYNGSQTEVFGRATSLDWSSDRGLLITAIVCFTLGILGYVIAARRR